MTRQWTLWAGAGVLAVMTGAAASASNAQEVSFIGGGAKGAWTRALTAMSECLRQKSEVRATVTPTQGGMDAFMKVQTGRGQFTINYQSVITAAWDGKAPFKNKLQNMLAVGSAERLAVAHFVVSKGSGIKSLADMAGKSIAPGPVGSVTRDIVGSFLKKVGILGKINAANVSSSEMNSFLKDGKIDGWIWLGGVPTPAATEAAASGNAVFLDVGKELEASGFLRENPFFRKVVQAAGSYPTIDYAWTSFGQNGILLAHKDVPAEVVYGVARTLWSDTCVDYLTNNLKSLSAMKGSPVDGLAFPLHPGAAKLWKEKGLDVSRVPALGAK
ncbi:MAG: TAXI family TRAP transporter solute-binding subunit [Betaproteobacteria bacterium]|nr:TAXI family TRAP transporter solute-binding subunit [Betaproteobacteria bacterium]